MSVEKVRYLLNTLGVEYSEVSHPPVITSQDAARIRHSDLSEGVKAIIFIADTNPIMICVPGDCRINTKKFKKIFSVKDLRMATSDELFKITNLEKGAVPPLGSIYNIKSYYSSEIIKKSKVSFNAGSRSISITMKASDLVRVENPILSPQEDFAVLS